MKDCSLASRRAQERPSKDLPLTIGYDASVTMMPHLTGIGRYTLDLLRGLVAVRDPRFQFVVLLNSLRHPLRKRHQFLLDAPNVEVAIRRIPGPMLVKCWAKLNRPGFQSLVGRQCDLIHAPAAYLPPERQKTLVTIHDLAFLQEEGDQSALAGRHFHSDFQNHLGHVKAIVTPSQVVAEEVRQTYALSPENIFAVHSGIRLPGARVLQSMKREELPDPRLHSSRFVFCPTSMDPRKRAQMIPRICERIRLMEKHAELLFVILGANDGMRNEYRDQDNLIFLPYQRTRDLFCLYRHAEITLLTSREEGFGFPAVESLSMGTPFLSNQQGAIQEVCGNLGFYTNEDTIDAYVEKLAFLLDSSLENDFKKKAAAFAGKLTWQRSALQYLQIYQELIESECGNFSS